MRRLSLLLLVPALALPACRTTRDADEEEVQEIDGLGRGVDANRTIAADQGQGALGATAGIYTLLMALSEKPEDEAEGSSSLYLTARDSGPGGPRAPELLAASASFASMERAEWPECVTEEGDTITYADCALEAGIGGAGFSFCVDGFYTVTDGSADADLRYDLSVGALGVSLDWGFGWTMGLDWTETTLDGDFAIDYAYGIMLGGSPTMTSVSFDATGTFEAVTWDEACGAPVSGTFDWRARTREGMELPEQTRVTVVWTGCGSATITQ